MQRVVQSVKANTDRGYATELHKCEAQPISIYRVIVPYCGYLLSKCGLSSGEVQSCANIKQTQLRRNLQLTVYQVTMCHATLL